MYSKKELRKRIINRRNALTQIEVLRAGEIIAEKVLRHPAYQDASVIYAYSATQNEVPLDLLFSHIFTAGKLLALPKIEHGCMNFHVISGLKDLEKGTFGIYEPKPFCCMAPKPELILVPGVAFTKDGFRLGYGGGFYDRFLCDNSAYSIGIGYSFQVLDEIPLEAFDRQVSEIITEI